MLSVIIPSRNETYLPQTIAELLANARGEIEVIVCLEGYWHNPMPPADPRLHYIHNGTAQGMRPAINAMAAMARGQYLMKLDAHCRVAEGYDLVLTEGLDDHTVVVPRRYGIEPETWETMRTGKYPVDAHYLSYPFENVPGAGLHGTIWSDRRTATAHEDISEEMSSQGSCWVMRRRHWGRIGDLDLKLYGNFIQEFQEIGLKTWLRDGRVLVNKKTWYAHLHKGKSYVGTDGRHGRGYFIDSKDHKRGLLNCNDFWMNNRWSKRTKDIRWFIEHFWPVPGWPKDKSGNLDWDQVERDLAAWNTRFQAKDKTL